MEWAPVEGVRGGTERRPLAGERHGTVTWTIGHCALTSVPSVALADNLPLFDGGNRRWGDVRRQALASLQFHEDSAQNDADGSDRARSTPRAVANASTSGREECYGDRDSCLLQVVHPSQMLVMPCPNISINCSRRDVSEVLTRRKGRCITWK